jgi:hypothetical protein
MTEAVKPYQYRKPKVGMWALHKNGNLDPRQVVQVSPDSEFVWIDIMGRKSGPFPASQYKFSEV